MGCIMTSKKQKGNETRRAQTCVPYDQIRGVVLLVEIRFERPHVDIQPVPMYVPVYVLRVELIHLRYRIG